MTLSEEAVESFHPEPTMALGGKDNTKFLGRTLEVSLELSSKAEKTSESGVAVDPDPAVDLGAPGHSDSPSTDTSATEKLLPAHLQSMFEDAKKHLTAEQAELVRQALIEFAEVFAINDLDIGKFTALVHYIRTGQALPIKQCMRRTPLGFGTQERATLERMLEAGVIEPSQSEWASPPVLVRKRDGTWRYCIDFRAVNSVSANDAYPLPLIEECLDHLYGKKWYCCLDMNSGYWQIPVNEEDKCKTAFITKYGLYQFVKLPFGLSGAPASFQRAMHLVLHGLFWKSVIVYLDDINVLGETFQETLDNLKVVFGRFRQYGLKLKPRKCCLFRKEATFLGRKISENGVEITDEHISAVKSWPQPKNHKDLERFLGFVNYHREFLIGMAGRTACLYALTGTKAKWTWSEEHHQAFEALKTALTTPPVLGFPNASDLFILDTDASDLAIGAELSQLQNDKERVISYASRVLNDKQRRYCTTRKELLAAVVFTRHYAHFLLGRRFIIRTDHASLTWIMRFRQTGGQLSRWLEELARYNFVIQHRKGTKHSNADGLSRIQQDVCDCYMAGRDLDSLPCSGCKTCARAHAQWKRFEEDVDDVVPLAYSSSDVRTFASSVAVQVPEESTTSVPGILMDQGNGEVEYLEVEDSPESPGESAPPVPGILVDQGVGQVQEGEAEDSKVTTEVVCEQDSEPGSVWNQGAECCATVPPRNDDTQGTGPPFKVSQISLANLFQSQSDNLEPQESAEESSMEEPEELTQRDSEEDSPSQSTESNFMHQYSMAELHQHQLEDPNLSPVIGWIESGQSPSEAELLLQSVCTKHYWHCRNQLKIIDGVLFYIWDKGTVTRDLLVIPRSLKGDIIKMFHDTPIGGHLGRDKTIAKIRQRAYWYELTRDIALHVATCRECSKSKRSIRHPRAPLQCFQAGYPGDHVHLDMLGPFSTSEYGNKYVLMIIDQFTRWLEMVPLHLQDAKSVARAFFENYVVRWGVPFYIHTDQGRNFESALFHSFCSLLEAVKSRTTPYRPSANGQVERYNQLVLNFLRCFLGKHQQDWDKFLPVLGMSIRSMVNRNTGFTPNLLQLGREINLPADVMLGLPVNRETSDTPADYAKQLIDRLSETYGEVRRNLKGAQKRQKTYYDRRVYPKKFNVGDLVYRRNSSVRKSQSRKLSPLFTGPYIVTEVLSPYLYRVQDRRKVLVLHHDRIKLCDDRVIPFWALRKRHALLQTGLDNPSTVDAQLEPPGDVQSVIADESQPRGAQADIGRGASATGENESVVTLADAELPNIGNGESGEMEEVSTQSLQADIGGEAAGVRDGSEENEMTTQGVQADTGRETASELEGAQEQGIVDSVAGDLDETIPYGWDQDADLDATIPYGWGPDPVTASSLAAESDELHWTDLEEWGLPELFKEVKTTRSGRPVRTPFRFR